MKRHSCLRCITCVGAAIAVALIATPAVAGGYSQGFQGAQSAGISGAVTARPDMPEAGYYNPAGWTLQQQWGIGGGGSLIIPIVIHEDPSTGRQTRAEVDGAFPPNVHAFGNWRDFAAGISVGVSHGAGLQWPEDWPGRFEVTSTSLQAIEASPSVAWRPLDRLAIGGGPRFVWGRVGYERFIDFARPGEEGFVGLEADAPGVGAQLGVWGAVTDRVMLGASWRSAIDLEFEGMANFEDIPIEMEDQAHDTMARTEMVLPHRFAAGVAYEVIGAGILSLDFEYTRWGAYETFDVTFDSDGVDDISEDRSWKHTLGMRAGAEYISPVDGLSVRSGLAIDPTPAPEDTLTPAQPDTDRTVMSLGAGYQVVEGLHFDMAYNFIILNRTTSADDGFSGIYDGQIHVFSVGMRATPWR